MNWINYIKQIISKILNIETQTTNTSSKMQKAVDTWIKMFENRADWLSSDIMSLNLASTIASEIARMVTLECKSEITGSKRADFLDRSYQNVINELKKNTEYACAKGGIVFKPYISNSEISVEIVQAEYFHPLEWDSRDKCTSGVFINKKYSRGFYYTRLEHHNLKNNKYTIINKAYKSKNEFDLGKECKLEEVDEWKDIWEETNIENIEKPLFGYFKMPFANNIDSNLKLGVSVYSRAVDLIKQADIQFSRILWEYEGSELAIDADVSILEKNKINGKLGLPKLKERLFRAAGQNRDGNSFYQIFSPEIRDSSLFKGLNEILKRIEFNCGLAYGTISDPQNTDKTATEIKTSKQRSYSTATNIQTSLQNSLEDLIYAMDVLCTLYNLAPNGTYETSFSWDDSIIVDSETEQRIRLLEVNAGLSSKAKYLMWRYGLTEEQAIEELKSIGKEQEAKQEPKEE